MPPLLKCPKCRRTDIVNQREHNKREAEKHAGHMMHAASHPLGLVPAIALGGASYVVSRIFGKDYKCQSCKHEFSYSGGCQWCTGKTTQMYTLKCCETSLCENCMNDVGYKCDFCGTYRHWSR